MTKPLLTPAEKSFLQAVIKPYRKWVIGIRRVKIINLITTYSDEIEIIFNNRHLSNIRLPIDSFSNSYQFKGIEFRTTYDLKTLGL